MKPFGPAAPSERIQTPQDLRDVRSLANVLWLNSLLYHMVKPAAALMDRLRFSSKVMLMGAIGGLAVGVMLFFLIPMLNEEIAFTEQERVGAEAIVPIVDYVGQMQRHRGNTNRLLNGEQDARGAVLKARDEANDSLASLDAFFAGNGAVLNVGEAWATIRDEWTALANHSESMEAPAAFAQHTALIASTLDLLTTIADRSNLTLDPELPSYMIYDTTVNRLPGYMEQLGQLRGAGAGALAAYYAGVDAAKAAAEAGDENAPIAPTSMAAGKLVTLLAKRDLSAYVYDRGRAGFQDVVATTPLLSPLSDQVQLVEKLHKAYMKLVADQFVFDQAPTVESGAYFAQGTELINASQSLVHAAVPLLDELLSDRIDSLTWHRDIVLAVCGFCGLLAGYAFFGFTRSLSATLRGLSRASHKLANGEFPDRIELYSKDELQDIADEIAKITVTLRRFDAAQRATAEKHEAGDTDARIDVTQFKGAFAEMAEALNEAFDGHIRVQKRMAEVVGRYARGDLSVRMEQLPGKRAEVSQAMEGVRERLERVNGEILRLAEAASRGEFSVRGNTDGLEFAFADMVSGLNALMQNAETGLNALDRLMSGLAQGDLRVRMVGDYQGMFAQLRDSAHATVDQLADVVAQITGSAAAINTASREISNGNNDLSARTEQQAAALEQTASAMEQATGTVKQNAVNARQANDLASSARDVASAGGQVVADAVETMRGIQESSHRIRDIISLIDGIAFQTNILALNAAVEAARAGEQGRGFAVVASEVRSLAQRSASAARDIAQLISTSVEQIGAGTALVDRAGETMKQIVSSVEDVTGIVRAIAHASEEQSAGIEQVNKAIAQIDSTTQQNAALVEEASAAARSMESEADNLLSMVSVFSLDGVQSAAMPGRAARRAA